MSPDDDDDDQPQPNLLTPEEAAAMLRVSPSTLYRERTRGEIHGTWVGRRVFYNVRDLWAYLRRHRRAG